MRLSHRLLEGADRTDALLDERRDDDRELAAAIDALSRAAFTPWPPEHGDTEQLRRDKRAERLEAVGLIVLAVVTLAWACLLAILAAEVMAG
jgi:hypothetical protein